MHDWLASLDAAAGAYHGGGKRPPFFEGWYYKLVDVTEHYRYAVIPGVFLSDDAGRHHA